jgi:hypothetical protein
VPVGVDPEETESENDGATTGDKKKNKSTARKSTGIDSKARAKTGKRSGRKGGTKPTKPTKLTKPTSPTSPTNPTNPINPDNPDNPNNTVINHYHYSSASNNGTNPRKRANEDDDLNPNPYKYPNTMEFVRQGVDLTLEAQRAQNRVIEMALQVAGAATSTARNPPTTSSVTPNTPEPGELNEFKEVISTLPRDYQISWANFVNMDSSDFEELRKQVQSFVARVTLSNLAKKFRI